MTTGDLLVGVGVLVIDKERLLLIKRGKEPHKGLWAVPGGKIRFGERLREAAAREVIEETGLIVEVGDVVWAGEVMDETRHMVLVDFAGTVVGGRLAASDDADDAQWVDLERIHEYPLTPTMYDLIETMET